MTTAPTFILTIRCRDAVGIVAAVSSTLAASGAFISESSHFGDDETDLFFMRTVFRVAGSRFTTIDDFRLALEPVAERFGMQMDLYDAKHRPKVMLAVSKHGHCLNHLLHRWHSDELPVDVVGVISNHDDMRRIAEWYGLPYHHLPMQGDKPAQEAQLLDRFESSGTELLVLARYMQVLSDDLCRSLEGRCINIHHSFLPSFKGAKPYHQAHGRGVKVVGATGHYVTADLDEGPIIEQDTVRVDHAMDAEAFVRLGKDVENIVLARAVQWHAERRVLLNGHRTVVFRHGG
ncbi:formyltetrahydrofolate deformylase [Roseateles toxinivorans]|uniref:Formyltetrahydrofolate deformylase n=1 Tax=Roseateles toxinivorans TaxID=270368 RepID=A0A4R6QFS0_9BURK|nr:formyltetrahydrofolate deformylase [Roseateles toxinivorans]TDP61240.1 formyltetrahydrofolate deformylase [Roseateles toxinivorans]